MIFFFRLAFTSAATFLLLDIAPEPELDPITLLFNLFFGLCGGISGLLSTVFMIWMLIDCIRNDSDRMLWVWIIFFFACFGPVVYFFMRYVPRSNFKLPQFITNMTRGREINQLEMTAQQIGNPHQYVQLGDALRETGKWDRAKDAYKNSLEKEPGNIQALWGAGLVAYETDDYSAAADCFQKVLEIDPQYKFGEVSLYMGKALVELQMTDVASSHFEEHIKRWPQPEARYLLATLYSDEGKTDAAREQLEQLLMGIALSPRSIARKSSQWVSKAKRMLKRL